MRRALVFDFDGTILDTETAEYRRWQELYESHGLRLELTDWQRGVGTWDGFDPWAALPREALQERERLAEELRERVLADIARERPRPGVREIIEEAARAGHPLAVASSSGRDWVEEWLGRHGLREYFPILATRDDVARVKPDPELYALAVGRLGVRPEEAVAIEDSFHGATAAVAAGLAVVVVPNAVTETQPFLPHWPRLSGFEGGLAGLLAAADGAGGTREGRRQ